MDSKTKIDNDRILNDRRESSLNPNNSNSNNGERERERKTDDDKICSK